MNVETMEGSNKMHVQLESMGHGCERWSARASEVMAEAIEMHVH